MYKVLKGFRGSPDGCRVIKYIQGQFLEVNTDFSDDLCQVALVEGWVVEVKNATPEKKTAAKKKKAAKK